MINSATEKKKKNYGCLDGNENLSVDYEDLKWKMRDSGHLHPIQSVLTSL